MRCVCCKQESFSGNDDLALHIRDAKDEKHDKGAKAWAWEHLQRQERKGKIIKPSPA